MKHLSITINGKRWRIQRNVSVFSTRSGLDDTCILVESDWGGLYDDEKRYRTCRRMKAENGEILRDYETIPSVFTLDFLRENGFIGLPTECGQASAGCAPMRM